jgi:hypothetical protein
VDPLTLAAAVVPFIVRYAQHFARTVGDGDDDAMPGVIHRLWKLVTDSFAGHDLACDALERLLAQPANARRQGAVEDYLAEIVGADAALSSVLGDLVREAQSQLISDVSVIDAGATAIGGAVTITAGGHAAGRDLTIS